MNDSVDEAKRRRELEEAKLAARAARGYRSDQLWFGARLVLTLVMVGVLLWSVVNATTSLNSAEQTIAQQQSFETARIKVVANDDAFFCAVRDLLTADAADPRFQAQANAGEKEAVQEIQNAKLSCPPRP